MKRQTLNQALQALKNLKQDFRAHIGESYEHRAKDCATCEVQGICCTDAHFVNVHITRLEAVAIRKTLEKLPPEKRNEVYRRNRATIEKYDLESTGDSFAKTYSCPLFEKGAGCLVHKEAKPLPCIQHACYERKDDLPPDELQTVEEKKVGRLNTQTYGNAWNWLPLPIWLKKVSEESNNKSRIKPSFPLSLVSRPESPEGSAESKTADDTRAGSRSTC